MDIALKKSFKSIGSYKNFKKKSNSPEAVPILSDQEDYHRHRHSSHSGMAGEVILKIDEGDSKGPGAAVQDGAGGRGGRIWRESSYDWKDEDTSKNARNSRNNEDFDFQRNGEDPPSLLIGQFLHKQKASGDMSLDMDLEMDELQHDRGLPSVEESPSVSRISKELKVSFEERATNVVELANESMRRRYKDAQGGEEFPRPPQPPQRHEHFDSQASLGGGGGGDGEVLRCTANASFDRIQSVRKSGQMRTKTKSRLMDPPEEMDRKSARVPRSGQLFSGLVGKKVDEEEDDPFLEEDIPYEFKRTHFSIWVLLEWLSLILIIAALACTLSIPYLRTKNLWKLKLWKWEVMVLVLICGRLVSDWVIRIVVFFIERNFLLRKRVLYFVYGVKKAVQNCLWLGLVLIAWHLLFDKRVERETKSDFLNYVTKVLVCFLVGTLVWLVKTLAVKVLASSFHVSTYFDRIQDSLFNQFVIETLSGPPLVEIHKAEEEEERLQVEVEKLQRAGATMPPDLKASALSSASKSEMVGKSGALQKSPRLISQKLSRVLSNKDEGNAITIDHLHKMNPKNVSAWNMKRLMNIVRNGTLTTLDEQLIDSANDDENATQIRSENEAKAAAKKIFQNVAKRGCRFIHMDDLMRFMKEEEVVKTMNLFEGAAESGKISKSALKNWVVCAFRERRALALTLNDTKTAVNKLHRMLNFLVAIIILVIWLLILEIATTKFLVVVSSQVVLVAFIFGNSCKTVFEAIIFLFVMHPFDVGDRCEIDGVQVVVEEMNILTTVFLRYDNQKIIYPNAVLATKGINNYYRSPDMGDAIDFCVHISTPPEKIAQMKQRINNFIDSKKEHWYPSPSTMIVFRDLDQLNMVKISIWPTHRINHQDMGERFVRRSHLVEELVKIIRELDIQYRLLPVDINVRSIPTSSERLPPSWATVTSQVEGRNPVN